MYRLVYGVDEVPFDGMIESGWIAERISAKVDRSFRCDEPPALSYSFFRSSKLGGCLFRHGMGGRDRTSATVQWLAARSAMTKF